MSDKELDELHSEFEEEQSDSEDPNAFRIREPLHPPVAKIYSTQRLHTLIHEGEIDLNPPYQRDVVWPTAKQVGLIDSLFRNFYIPPIIFAVRKDELGDEVRECVDGKQRLTSIQKFFDGQIPHKDSITKKNFWFTRSETQKSSRLEIPDHFKKIFSEKQITCVEYYNLPHGKERDIFQRVQLGVTLTTAEKLQALDSPWTEWISQLEAKYVSCDQGLSQMLLWDIKRGRDFQCLAQLVYCCYALPKYDQPTAQKLEKWLASVDKPQPSFKAFVESVLQAYLHIASEDSLRFGFTGIGKRVAPVEFVYIGVLLARTHQDYDMEVRAEAIKTLRTAVRARHVDVRANGEVSKTLWETIEQLVSASPAQRAPGSQGFSDDAQNAQKKMKKRKRKANDEDIDEDYRPAPIQSFGPTPKTRKKPAPLD